MMFKGFWPLMADDPDASPVHREIGRLENAMDKVVVSDSVTEFDGSGNFVVRYEVA
jgi:hypothetical protein